MNKMFAFAAAAVLGMGSMAMGQTSTPLPSSGQVNNQTAAVPVKVVMPAVVSVWADYTPVTLTVGQSDGDGFDGVAKTLSYINNVPATVSVRVDGDLPNVPSGTNFFIFTHGDVVAAEAAAQANGYTPANALNWTNAGAGNLGSTKVFAAGLTPDIDGGVLDLVYAANIPGGVAAPPDDFDLVVTWTIAAD